MNTKIIIAATVAALSLATTAFAAEGEGRNQPFPTPTTSFSASVPASDTGSAGYQGYTSNRTVAVFNNASLPENGQNGAVQTANSLPVGFESGTVQFAQADHVNQWFAQQAQRTFAQTHTGTGRRS